MIDNFRLFVCVYVDCRSTSFDLANDQMECILIGCCRNQRQINRCFASPFFFFGMHAVMMIMGGVSSALKRWSVLRTGWIHINKSLFIISVMFVWWIVCHGDVRFVICRRNCVWKSMLFEQQIESISNEYRINVDWFDWYDCWVA